MTHIIADRVRESASVTGLGDFTLSGAVTNFDPFSANMSNGDTCDYAAVSSAGGWEVGLGTKTTGGLARTTIYQSSNSDAKVNFNAGGSGVVDLFLVVPAQKLVTANSIGSVIDGLSGKTSPVDADELVIADSAASFAPKKLTWANLKAALKTTAANIWAGTNDALFVTAKNAADSNAFVTLTSSTAIATDASLGYNFFITLAHNTTLGAPTNLIDGRTYQWLIQQDATGSRTGAFNAIFEFGATPTLSTAAGKRDLIVGTYHAASGKIIASFRKAA